MNEIELDYYCDYCGTPIDDGEGCLEIRFSDLTEYREAVAEWERVNGAGDTHTLGELLTLPEVVPWRLRHDRCNPNPNPSADGYDVDVRRVRTWRTLLAETARLMAKNWLTLTDWPQVIGAAAEKRSGRIKEHAQHETTPSTGDAA